MNRNWLQIGIVLFTMLWGAWAGAFGQSCSTTQPCVPVAVTGVTGQSTTLVTCGGGSLNCSQSALDQFMQNPSASNPWHILATFPQTAATMTYNDLQNWGNLLNYAAYQTPSGGAASPVSAIAVFQIPQAPQVAPTIVAGPKVVTTGKPGVQ